jgi:hypothetical protein
MRQINILPAPQRDESKVAEMTKRGHRVLFAGLFPSGGNNSSRHVSGDVTGATKSKDGGVARLPKTAPTDFLNRKIGEPRESLQGTGVACFAYFKSFAVHSFFHASLRKSLIFMIFPGFSWYLQIFLMLFFGTLGAMVIRLALILHQFAKDTENDRSPKKRDAPYLAFTPILAFAKLLARVKPVVD